MPKHREQLDAALSDRAAFWGEQARRIDWETDFSCVHDASNAPFSKWFVGGRTNLCHNAVDRHLAGRAGQPALIAVSSETGDAATYRYSDLHREVNIMAAALLALGVRSGDRVLIYLPMIAEANFAMLACARIGAVHSVVFGGFAAAGLALRIDDARPMLVISADAGFSNGRIVPYKPLLDQAIGMALWKPPHVMMIDRGLAPFAMLPRRDCLYRDLHAQYADASVPCEWLESNRPSYILHTSGTTGNPKGVQRDVGGYAVMLAASMDKLFGAQAGETMFATSDIGWVVGHSYGVYGPLLTGMTTLMHEGTPLRPDGDVWWRLAERYRVNLMLSAPTAIRLLKRQGRGLGRDADLSSLRALFLAGEPLDAPTASWAEAALGKPVIDHYWQTESGSPMLALPHGDAELPRKTGSPGLPAFGFDLEVVRHGESDIDGKTEAAGSPCAAGERGVIVVHYPLPPGCFSTLWENDADFSRIYWSQRNGRWVYSTFDWGVADEDGHVHVLGRSDDVIIVAGGRLGTREIEEVMLGHEAVAEVAVLGVSSRLRGQVPIALVVLNRAASPAYDGDAGRGRLEIALGAAVAAALGTRARPRKIVFVDALPRTRSGKVLRRLIQTQIGKTPGADLAQAVEQVHALVAAG
ncbi:propionate--CoA ligase [Oxalobacteraceae bacterium CAVE-383]|nr:propionate--CoA ligase [Oxalobacteraceae bacterium CAVE-383]